MLTTCEVHARFDKAARDRAFRARAYRSFLMSSPFVALPLPPPPTRREERVTSAIDFLTVLRRLRPVQLSRKHLRERKKMTFPTCFPETETKKRKSVHSLGAAKHAGKLTGCDDH